MLACDGLWDKVTHEEASLFVSKLLHYKTLEHATEFLMEEALGKRQKKIYLSLKSVLFRSKHKRQCDGDCSKLGLVSGAGRGRWTRESRQPQSRVCAVSAKDGTAAIGRGV